MSEFQSKIFRGFIKGVNAVVDRYSQPLGSLPRSSNLIFTKRGSLITCDGSLTLHSFNGVPTAGRGKIMAGIFYSPTGQSKYYLAIAKALDIPLGPPQNLTIATAAGGSLPAATYFYIVTATDNAGGETSVSNEVSQVTPLNNKNTLTWNIVPNAINYNIYRSTASGTERQLAGSVTAVLPVSQPAPGNLTASFIDDGTTISSVVLNVASVYKSGPTTAILTLASGTVAGFTLNYGVTIAGNSILGMNVPYFITSFISPTQLSIGTGNAAFVALALGTTGNGGTATFQGGLASFIGADTTQQTALFKMPVIAGAIASVPTPYNNSNIVAFYPADATTLPLPDGGGGGGSGKGGGTGAGGSTGGTTGGTSTSTPTASGGIPGNVSFLPEMVQFSNRIILALGNGFPGHIFSDPNTLTNSATTSAITAISVDAFGVVTVTVTGGHGMVAAHSGGSVQIKNVTLSALYNGTFVVLQVVSATVFKVRNLAAIGLGAGNNGSVITTSLPIISTFTQGFPVWGTGVTYLVGDLIQPTVANGHYYKCIQAGISAAGQPAFPTVSGQQVQEATPSKVIWQEAGLTNANAPPPQGLAHVKVYAGSLWAWNTAPTNTPNGLDGPTCIRMSDSNNPNSWNPINQAFLDKDDGTEGVGLSPFTIAGFGIPPEGSLVAFKQYAGYQLVGVFGSSNFLIQRIKSSLGCIAARTIQFATGYGLIRFSHLGFAVFDGMNDRLVDDDIHPYIFPVNEQDYADITTVDFSAMSLSWATQTAYPAMYTAFFPIGNSGGALTRAFCYDLVLKSWSIVDLPFGISTAFQAFSDVAVPVTVLGSIDDGCLHRWQAGDETWANTIDAPGPSQVAWNLKSPMVYNEKSLGGRIYCRQLVLRGRMTHSDVASTLNVSFELQGEASYQANGALFNLGQDGTFALNTPVNEKVTNLDAIISGAGGVEINSLDFQIKPEVATVPARLT